MKVTKRNGQTEAFQIEKIKQVIQQACEDLDVNPLALESKFDEFLFDGISTKQLQANLIEHAKTMCTPQEPDWTFVAGRLETMNRWADTRSYDIGFEQFFKEQKELGFWTHPKFESYSPEEVKELGDYIVKERDLEHSYSSVLTAKSKYLMTNECIQHMFMGNAMIIAACEAEENKMDFAKLVYDVLSERKISLATPWLSNLRCNGNISSCFIISVNDDLNSIYDNLKKAAQISKNGGGLGVDLARMRARGSKLMGNEGASGGMIGWAKLFNDTAIFVNQGGKRAGAFTVSLPVWHADIADYLDIQTEAGDQRKKAYDIKTQVGFPDYFMETKNDESSSWYTFCPHEVKEALGIELYDLFGDDFKAGYMAAVNAYQQGKLKVVRTFNAKELFKKVMRVQFETGMPYIAFTCEINRHNPNKHVGNIPCTNLCTESYSVVIPDELDHTCNLASVVMGRVAVDDIEKYSAIATRILSNGLILTTSPTESSKKHNDLLATIGVGMQGYADLVARENKIYLDEKFAAEVSERMEWGCVEESIKLAKERGAYKAFKGSEWDNGNKIKHLSKNSVLGKDWISKQKEIDQYGIHNSQLTSPAPNTSTSIFMDAAAGIMPVYSAFFYEDNKDGLVPVTSMYLKENPLSYARDVTKFKPWELTKIVGKMQLFIDTGISAEYMMDKNQQGFSAKWLWDTIENAWLNKNKAVYYIRTIKKGEKLVIDNDVCVGCAG